MKTKKIFWYVAALSMIAAGLTACNKAESGEDGGEQTGNTRFRVSVNDETLTSESVTVSVTCTGGSDTWYCFVTDDMESDIEKAIADELAVITDYQSVLKAGNQSVTFNGLQQRTAYRAIVTGLLTDGTPVGTPDDEEFTTPLPEGTWVVNENWSCTYIERDDMIVDPEQGTTVYGDILTFTVKSGVDFYLPAVVSVDDLENKFHGDIYEFAKSELAIVQAEIDARNAQGQDVMWIDYIMDYTMTGTLGVLDSSLEWYAVMLGVDPDGEGTGLYVLSEPFTPKQEVADAGYTKWLGKWKIIGQGNYNETITITADENNYQYLVDGWETSDQGGTKGHVDFPPFYARYDKTSEEMTFMAQDALQSVNVEDLDIQNPQNVTGKAELGFYAFFDYNTADQMFNTISGSYPIAIMSMDASGSVTVEKQAVDTDKGTQDILGMWYSMMLIDWMGGGYEMSFDFVVPRFPYAMVRAEDTDTPEAVTEVTTSSVRSAPPVATNLVRAAKTWSMPRFAKQ